jgi:NTP pyrophosphatase (non-canonical NTP hydrolase)
MKLKYYSLNDMENYISQTKDILRKMYLENDSITTNDLRNLFNDIDITIDTFQEETNHCAYAAPKHLPDCDIILALGLAEEAGECISVIKKSHRNDGGVLTDKRKNQLFDEMGDCLFYLCALAKYHGFKMSEIMKANQIKVLDRTKNGKVKNLNYK